MEFNRKTPRRKSICFQRDKIVGEQESSKRPIVWIACGKEYFLTCESCSPICSIVIPVMNEEGNVEFISKKVIDALRNNDSYEILFIDDGSSDNTLSTLKQLHRSNPLIKYVSFSRNFGHQSALRAAIDNAKGDCVISLDGDLQHPPELIPDMIEKWKTGGYDIVYTIRKEDKKLSFFKRTSSRFFYYVLNQLSDVKIEPGSADFRLLDRKVVDSIRQFQESPLFFRGIVPWVGFRQCAIEYTPKERFSGSSKYSLRKMFNFALNGILSFSVKPLLLPIYLGVIVSFLEFCCGIYEIIQKLFFSHTVPDWALIIIVVSFISGIQLIGLGIIGVYIGKLFIDGKRRPPYIIREKSNG
jgi:dolichol-phosphate mannosyltransferase